MDLVPNGIAGSLPSPARPATRRRRPLTVALVALATAMALIAAIGVVLASASPVVLPSDTPAGAIQSYLTAYLDGDTERAYHAFSRGVQEVMSETEFERSASEWARDELRSQRVVLQAVEADAHEATVHLRVETGRAGGLFQTGSYGWETTVQLNREADAWRIDEALAGLEPAYYE